MKPFLSLLGGCLTVLAIPFVPIVMQLINAWLAVVATEFVIDPVFAQFGIGLNLGCITFWQWVGLFLTITGVLSFYRVNINVSDKDKQSTTLDNINIVMRRLTSPLFVIVSLYILHWLFL